MMPSAEPSPDFLELTRDRALALLRSMIRIRRFEEKCAELYAAGRSAGSCTCTSAKRRSPPA